MRFALSLAALAASSASLLDNAAACGWAGETPRLLQVSHHMGRTFVVLDDKAPADVKWTLLSPYTYDYTRIAEAPELAGPIQLTLLGPSGTRVVTATQQVFLDDAWDPRERGGHLALEVRTDTQDYFNVAIEGRARGVSWRGMTSVDKADGEAKEWLAAHGRSDVRYVSVQAIAGTSTEVVTWFDADVHFAVRDHGFDRGDRDGIAIGELDMHGRRLIVRRDLSIVTI